MEVHSCDDTEASISSDHDREQVQAGQGDSAIASFNFSGCAGISAFLQDAKSKLREIAEKRADDVEEVMAHLEKTLLRPC